MITRFCPTLNGPLHISHIYCILVNLTEAHRSGGKFIIRLDDSQPIWRFHCGDEAVARYATSVREDMDWLGIKPDVWSTQTQLMPEVERFCEFAKYPLPPTTFGDFDVCTIHGAKLNPYPGNERLTIEHVIMDFIEKVNWVIRGWDLITEDGGYVILNHKLGLPRVKRDYIHRADFEGDEVSKTEGKYKISEFRDAGMTAKDLLSRLANDCLIFPEDEWTIDNIKDRPVLGNWAKEILSGFPK